jgi:hypothetical protein
MMASKMISDNRLSLQCQLAHGSSTYLLTGIYRLDQLYQSIADSYENLQVDDVNKQVIQNDMYNFLI